MKAWSLIMYYSIKDLSSQESISSEEAKNLWYKYYLSGVNSIIPWLALLMLFLFHALAINAFSNETEFNNAFVYSLMKSVFLYVGFVIAFIMPAISSRNIRRELNRIRQEKYS
jgi:uncharacterized membrane protein